MAYNEQLAVRVREMLCASAGNKIAEKKMFGGLCFMVRDKMCIVVRADSILIRLHPDDFQRAVDNKTLDPMLHIGRVMTGFGYVSESQLKTKQQLHHWVSLALHYNEQSPSAKKKGK
jgi:TfoX/Sxy family transcriptional regulator of competence genes